MSDNASGVTLVVGTRFGKDDFFEQSLLAKTLVRNPATTRLQLFLDNRRGLPQIYNEAIAGNDAGEDQIFVFAHDDIMICDLFWENRIAKGLDNFDILGVAGTKVRHSGQPSWIFKSIDLDENLLTREDLSNLSGRVGHGDGYPPKNVSRYGDVPQQVKLLDGVLLCVRASTLNASRLRFDERFDFHFYDLDFCREAEARGLKCGTVDVSLVHRSGGNFGSTAWLSGYDKYIAKWGS